MVRATGFDPVCGCSSQPGSSRGRVAPERCESVWHASPRMTMPTENYRNGWFVTSVRERDHDSQVDDR